jgi:hypothetical protein
MATVHFSNVYFCVDTMNDISKEKHVFCRTDLRKRAKEAISGYLASLIDIADFIEQVSSFRR